MTEAERQSKRRKKLKEDGYVDIRVSVMKTTRERLRIIAQNNKNTLQDEIRLALSDHIYRNKSLI